MGDLTDKEKFEFAAKAYWGNEIDDVCSIRWLEEEKAIGYTHGKNQDHNGKDQEFVWNPRDDDGDALRLAAKLHLTYRIIHGYAEAFKEKGIFSAYTCKEPINNDQYAATRLAIFNAAVEIGKEMK